ncbi:restriction endonuclease subunit S [Gemmata sp.]|uniref:restriction endonuclease subunit S n=1 Tax=Gemmata sp. TaxID=1914242 RepID=UPI003F6F5B07
MTTKRLQETIPAGSYLWLKTGDLLVQRSNTIELVGTAAVYDGPLNTFVYPDLMMRMRLKESATTRFVWRYINSLAGRTFFTRMAAGSSGSMPKVSGTKLRTMQIPLPPLPEQRRIADVLDRAESLRAKRRDALAKLDTLTQAIFTDMFETTSAIRSESQLVRLADVSTRITDGTHLTPQFLESGVPFLFVTNVRNGRISFETDIFISDADYQRLYQRCPVEEGDILYTTVGATYGHAAGVGGFTKFAFQRHIAHVKPDRTRIHPQFLAALMQLPLVKRQADRWARGAAQPTVNLKELREFLIPCPPLLRQQEFARRVTAVEQLRSAHRASLVQLDALFASLQHRAFRGELQPCAGSSSQCGPKPSARSGRSSPRMRRHRQNCSASCTESWLRH